MPVNMFSNVKPRACSERHVTLFPLAMGFVEIQGLVTQSILGTSGLALHEHVDTVMELLTPKKREHLL